VPIEIGIAIEIAIEICAPGEYVDKYSDPDPDPDPDFDFEGMRCC